MSSFRGRIPSQHTEAADQVEVCVDDRHREQLATRRFLRRSAPPNARRKLPFLASVVHTDAPKPSEFGDRGGVTVPE